MRISLRAKSCSMYLSTGSTEVCLNIIMIPVVTAMRIAAVIDIRAEDILEG